jgi:hypothetical protein
MERNENPATLLRPGRSASISITWRKANTLPYENRIWDLDDPDEESEEDPWLENPLMSAEELLRFSRIRQLL